MKELTELKQLQMLFLSDTGLTDGCVEDLKKISQLTALSVRGTKITEAGVKELKKVFPKCLIIHDTK